MKKDYSFTDKFGKKSIILGAVSLVLVLMIAVGATASWIEEVSQVEFSSTDGQETPLHIGSKVLKSDAVIKSNPTTEVINLSDYFYESGDMHLSPCYSDGDNFYFPVEGGGSGYRVGTKDDANVNYLSATFRVRSEGANTAYWFEKSGEIPYISFKKDDTASNDTTLTQYLRCSVTIDGVTNVYALNANGKYKTIESNAVAQKDGKRIDQYAYYSESFRNNNPEGYYKNTANVTNKPNQGNGENLNGNTLFTVNKYDATNKTGVKVVTVKIWLECNGINTDTVNVTSVNMNFVSSWAKTRRVYVKDATVHQDGYTSKKWLSNNSAKLYFALNNNLDINWQMTRVSSNSDYYYADIPAVYNNVETMFFRCSTGGLTSSSNQTAYTKNGKTVYYWDKWKTTFPDTFHSEVYTVYSTDFATWEDADNVHSVYFVNSAFFSNVYDYMWDSNSVHGTGINDKVVKNAGWPGLKMTTKMATSTNSQSLPAYAFFYNSDYDRIIFNDGDLVAGANQEYQTQDLWLTDSGGNPLDFVGGTFDMTTLTWFHTNPTASDWSTKMPSYSAANTYIYGNFSTNNAWKQTRFAYGGEYSSTSGNAFNGSSSTHMLCKIYLKQGNNYEFKLCYNGTWYGAYNDGDKRVTPKSNYYIDGTLIPNQYAVQSDSNHTSNFILVGGDAKSVIRIYFDTNDMKLYFATGEN